MGRLIDADSLMKKFCVNSDGRRIPEVDCDNIQVTVPIKDIKKIIREQPTAYDVDVVVEELEANAQKMSEAKGNLWDSSDHRYYKAIGTHKAEQIVRRGGV